jgi:ubiquinone/menaquinone biosynthesis C-methylase UbiE
VVASPYDTVAELYDETRGGEPRGERYAAELATRIVASPGPVLEIGVGTGLVSLGLQRRGLTVVGVDLSSGMLGKAKARLGDVVVRGDVGALPFRSNSLDNVVAVWMVQAVADQAALFREVFRVVRPGGRFLVCPTNRPALRDPIGVLIAQMFVRLERQTATRKQDEPRPVVDPERVLSLGLGAGFTGYIEQLPDERWDSSLEAEIRDIENRTWAPLAELDEELFAAVAEPTLAELRRMKPGPKQRRATAHVVVLDRPVGG